MCRKLTSNLKSLKEQKSAESNSCVSILVLLIPVRVLVALNASLVVLWCIDGGVCSLQPRTSLRCLHRPWRESRTGEWLAISSRINTWLFSLFRQTKQPSWNPNRPASPKFNLVFACGYIGERQHRILQSQLAATTSTMLVSTKHLRWFGK